MERRISVMEMRMLRWMGGITQLDRICNRDVQQRFGSGLYSSSGDSHVSIQQYSFNNGDCKYEDGYIIENGQRRQATPQEIDRINQYKQAINDYMRKVNGYVTSNKFLIIVVTAQATEKYNTLPNARPTGEVCGTDAESTRAQIEIHPRLAEKQ
ncbi:hypothetical protein ANCDUO_13755 [Ancylostoma duodenale]|uniref:Uncharacterized protein n=1 Tax=Ancylostoma duodenale TaxID=51022 RepID=A0A0C2G508_9BILA|nr:hypothetical protein ANCDUO_13755 [Ancylostoma duodenale]